jgi:hypothetical protein
MPPYDITGNLSAIFQIDDVDARSIIERNFTVWVTASEPGLADLYDIFITKKSKKIIQFTNAESMQKVAYFFEM